VIVNYSVSSENIEEPTLADIITEHPT